MGQDTTDKLEDISYSIWEIKGALEVLEAALLDGVSPESAGAAARLAKQRAEQTDKQLSDIISRILKRKER